MYSTDRTNTNSLDKLNILQVRGVEWWLDVVDGRLRWARGGVF